MGWAGEEGSGDPIDTLSARAAAGIERILEALPSIPALAGDDPSSREMYAQVILQDILRIRLNNHLDAYCLQHLLRSGETEAARQLLTYLYEEFGHDVLLLEDLAPLGYGAGDVDAAAPLFSTELLIAYLKYAIDVDGALPDFVWNWFVEWYSARYNPGIVKAASAVFGDGTGRGTSAHLSIDEELDHEHRIEIALRNLVTSEEDLHKAEFYLDRILRLLDLYFRELIGAEGVRPG